MRILWICNKAPQPVAAVVKNTGSSFGGWLDDMCSRILRNPDNNLCVSFPFSSLEYGSDHNLSYCTFLERKCEDRFVWLVRELKPDLIHIWGTEFPHAEAMMTVCTRMGLEDKVVISIQGLVSVYGKYHYTEGLPYSVVHGYTFRDFLRRDNIARQKKSFLKRGAHEISALTQARHVIGRTDWDQAAVSQINPDAIYHFCNESLRSVFYENHWSIAEMKPHTIFISQCSYPIKGFHYFLEALPEIIKVFPDTHVYTTGRDLLCLSTGKKFEISSYQKYLRQLIKRYHLEKHITFLGPLNAEQMCRQYLRANVFISPSVAENSSNSVGEAMLLGCPVITSDAGGIRNLLTHEKEGFIYQTSAPYMLAYYVKKVFSDTTLACELSANARRHALCTHDRTINFRRLCQIYREVISESDTFC